MIENQHDLLICKESVAMTETSISALHVYVEAISRLTPAEFLGTVTLSGNYSAG
jgi:hypothetical protein